MCARGKSLENMARPERFELPTFWFVGRSSKTSKCRYWYRLRANAPLILPLSWTEVGRKFFEVNLWFAITSGNRAFLVANELTVTSELNQKSSPGAKSCAAAAHIY